MKNLLAVMLVLATLSGMVYAGGAAEDNSKPVVVVWLPNESGDDVKSARDAMGTVVEKALGRKVEHKLTTDYNILIETIATGKAHIAFVGAQQYVLASNKNPNIKPLVINAPKGDITQARYYSWLAVKTGNEGPYKSGNGFSLDKIAGKKFSWVSTSSTSGFKVPSSGILSYFQKKSGFEKLKSDDLLEGGQGKFFSEVLFGSSHQGSAVNLITGKADIAAFCDTCVNNYFELVSGTENSPGAVYRVRKDAAEPFNNMAGEQVTIISATPVLNGPIMVDTKRFSPEQLAKLRDTLISDETAKMENLFAPSGKKGLYKAGEKFIPVEESFFNPIRALNK